MTKTLINRKNLIIHQYQVVSKKLPGLKKPKEQNQPKKKDKKHFSQIEQN